MTLELEELLELEFELELELELEVVAFCIRVLRKRLLVVVSVVNFRRVTGGWDHRLMREIVLN